MFESSDGDVKKMSAAEIQAYLDEGRLFRAMQAKEQGDNTQAIKLFEQINTAEAAFQMAQVGYFFYPINILLFQSTVANNYFTDERMNALI